MSSSPVPKIIRALSNWGSTDVVTERTDERECVDPYQPTQAAKRGNSIMTTIIYHKYRHNRRIYDTTNACYSSVANIGVQLLLGNTVIVYLHPGKEKAEAGVALLDITNQIILQALLEQEIEKPFLRRSALLALWPQDAKLPPYVTQGQPVK